MPSKYIKKERRTPKVLAANKRNAKLNTKRWQFNGVGKNVVPRLEVAEQLALIQKAR